MPDAMPDAAQQPTDTHDVDQTSKIRSRVTLRGYMAQHLSEFTARDRAHEIAFLAEVGYRTLNTQKYAHAGLPEPVIEPAAPPDPSDAQVPVARAEWVDGIASTPH